MAQTEHEENKYKTLNRLRKQNKSTEPSKNKEKEDGRESRPSSQSLRPFSSSHVVVHPNLHSLTAAHAAPSRVA